jgi:hypothetical protein
MMFEDMLLLAGCIGFAGGLVASMLIYAAVSYFFDD